MTRKSLYTTNVFV